MPSNAAFDSASSNRSPGGRARLGRCLIVLAAAAATVAFVAVGNAVAASLHGGNGQPDFGPNVVIFDPSMPTSQIQATVDAIANQQVSEPVRNTALRAAVQAGHLRHGRRLR